MNKLKIIRLASLILIALGLLGVAPTLYYRYKLATANAMPTVPVNVAPVALASKPDVITGVPVRITIPSVKIDTAIVPGTYDQKSKAWTLGLHTAHFATITTQPNNEAGNTYIYGHYRPEVFAYLHAIKAGGEAIVTTDNGYEFTYAFKEVKTINPADTSVFAYQGPPILTLQTCSGAWFQNRQQYTFDFVNYKKI
jgi:LPXTG-site transpeptidase (sortase) family protein